MKKFLIAALVICLALVAIPQQAEAGPLRKIGKGVAGGAKAVRNGVVKVAKFTGSKVKRGVGHLLGR